MPKNGWRVKDPQEFIRNLVQGIQDAGEKVFSISQQDGYCPVDEGTLRESGVFEATDTGFKITYRTSYAARQEFGLPAGHTEQVKAHTVGAYTAKAMSRLPHQRTMKNGKVVQVVGYTIPSHEVKEREVEPFTRVFENGVEGKFYLTRAWEEVKPELSKFIADLYRRSK